MKKLFIAPLAGVSNIPFRLACLRYGTPVQYTEMVLDKALFIKRSKTRSMLVRAPEEKELGAQLLGNDPETMAEAARYVESLGINRVDLNFGCPVRKVVSKGQGSALLKDPQRIERIMAAVSRAVHIPISAKMRSGWHDNDEKVIDIAKMAEYYGFSHLTVHGRPWKKQPGYPVDFNIIRKIKESVLIPIIANGSVFSAADARKMVDFTGADGVMLARGVMGRPWLVRAIEAVFEGRPEPPAPGAQEIVEAFRLHVEDILKYLDPAEQLFQLKKTATWYLRGFVGNKHIRIALYATRATDDFMAVFREQVLGAGLELSVGHDDDAPGGKVNGGRAGRDYGEDF